MLYTDVNRSAGSIAGVLLPEEQVIEEQDGNPPLQGWEEVNRWRDPIRRPPPVPDAIDFR